MIPFTLAQVAAAVSGELVGGPAAAGVTVRRVTVDSRAVQPGDLFVAMSGERVDGHDYVDAAVAAGAAAVLSNGPRLLREWWCRMSWRRSAGWPVSC